MRDNVEHITDAEKTDLVIFDEAEVGLISKQLHHLPTREDIELTDLVRVQLMPDLLEGHVVALFGDDDGVRFVSGCRLAPDVEDFRSEEDRCTLFTANLPSNMLLQFKHEFAISMDC